MGNRDAQNWGRIGGKTAWSRHGVDTMLTPARRGFAAKFEREVVHEDLAPVQFPWSVPAVITFIKSDERRAASKARSSAFSGSKTRFPFSSQITRAARTAN